MRPFQLLSAPAESVVRIAGQRYAPFSVPPWRVDPATGRLLAPSLGRYDDSGPTEGRPESEWFRTIYAATDPQGSYGELLAALRVRPQAITLIESLERTIPGTEGAITSSADSSVDPKFPNYGAISQGWRRSRQITQARVNHAARFVDISHPRTLSFLLTNVVSELESIVGQRLDDFDLSDVMGRNRTLTQFLARYFHDLPGEEIAGIRYLSRHSAAWECWALFADRVAGKLEIGESRPIAADDPDLLAVARQFGLSVETDTPGEYLRPWQ